MTSDPRKSDHHSVRGGLGRRQNQSFRKLCGVLPSIYQDCPNLSDGWWNQSCDLLPLPMFSIMAIARCKTGLKHCKLCLYGCSVYQYYTGSPMTVLTVEHLEKGRKREGEEMQGGVEDDSSSRCPTWRQCTAPGRRRGTAPSGRDCSGCRRANCSQGNLTVCVSHRLLYSGRNLQAV